MINPHLTLNVFQLDDACGVGATMPEIQACVLTQETKKGGDMINEARAKQEGFPPIDSIFVDMILSTGGSSATEFSNKTSSTYIREFLEKEKQKEESAKNKK